MIPIKNIYYLYCYAWEKLEEKEIVSVKANPGDKVLDLLVKILMNGTAYLFKKGLKRTYFEQNENISGIKGKLNLSQSIKQNLLAQAQSNCSFDVLDYNVRENQILRKTLENLTLLEELNPKLKKEIFYLLKIFPKVNSIKIESKLFENIELNALEYFYDFMLNVCELIHENLLVEEKSGKLKFQDLWQDEKQMANLFERFVRNFYKIETKKFQEIKRENINWKFASKDKKAEKFLPKMQTDVSLISKNDKIIVETKFYKQTFQKHFDSEKIHSQNLYQLFAYLKNIDSENKKVKGILLYPTVNQSLNLKYYQNNLEINVRTINLNQNWKKIHKEMLEIVEQ